MVMRGEIPRTVASELGDLYSRADLSVSGGQRNRLFFNAEANEFVEIGAISGLDHPGDSRSFVRFDYDRDGFLDVAVASANAPLLRIFRNQIGSVVGSRGKTRSVAVRLVGGAREGEPAAGWSNRDAIGAVIEVLLEGRRLRRELAAGEGLASQNGLVQTIGVGAADTLRELIIHWPSGRTDRFGDLPAEGLLTIHERRSAAAASGLVRTPLSRVAEPASRDTGGERVALGPDAPRATLSVYTTVATWCAACKDDLPQLARLRGLFSLDTLALVGVPGDPEETPQALRGFAAEYDAAYALTLDLPPATLADLSRARERAFLADAIPVSVIVGRRGRVLDVAVGAPSVSKLRRLLARQTASARSSGPQAGS